MVTEGNPYKYAAVRGRRIRKRDSQRLDDSMRIEGLYGTPEQQKKSDRMSEKHPAAIQFGVPRSEPRFGRAGGGGASGHSYNFLARNEQYCESIRSRKIMQIYWTSGNTRKRLGI